MKIKQSTKITRWTLDALQEEALRFSNRTDFVKNSKAGKAAAKRRILDQICGHMLLLVKKPYTIEELCLVAKKYETRTDFMKNALGAYDAAHRLGILDQICEHMNILMHIWSYEELRLEALKYNTRNEFLKNDPNAYQIIHKRGLSDDLLSHMPKSVLIGCVPHNKKWTHEKLSEEALRYTTRTEFFNKSQSAYSIAALNGLLDEICGHMKRSGNISLPQSALFDTIKSIYPNAKTLRRRNIKMVDKPHIKGFDIDIYIPELMKGIEFDGRYWHSELGLKRSRKHWPEEDILNYHRIKDEYFKIHGIEVLHINEKDWIDNAQKCIDECLAFLGNKC